ncbi:hypothetical protein PCE1_000609 [Barthelona sp. PCE]
MSFSTLQNIELYPDAVDTLHRKRQAEFDLMVERLKYERKRVSLHKKRVADQCMIIDESVEQLRLRVKHKKAKVILQLQEAFDGVDKVLEQLSTSSHRPILDKVEEADKLLDQMEDLQLFCDDMGKQTPFDFIKQFPSLNTQVLSELDRVSLTIQDTTLPILNRHFSSYVENFLNSELSLTRATDPYFSNTSTFNARTHAKQSRTVCDTNFRMCDATQTQKHHVTHVHTVDTVDLPPKVRELREKKKKMSDYKSYSKTQLISDLIESYKELESAIDTDSIRKVRARQCLDMDTKEERREPVKFSTCNTIKTEPLKATAEAQLMPFVTKKEPDEPSLDLLESISTGVIERNEEVNNVDEEFSRSYLQRLEKLENTVKSMDGELEKAESLDEITPLKTPNVEKRRLLSKIKAVQQAEEEYSEVIEKLQDLSTIKSKPTIKADKAQLPDPIRLSLGLVDTDSELLGL